jgi:hypothetical protein
MYMNILCRCMYIDMTTCKYLQISEDYDGVYELLALLEIYRYVRMYINMLFLYMYIDMNSDN